MNPRALALWSLAAAVLALLSTNPIDRSLLLLVSLNVAVAVCRPDRSIRGALWACLTVSVGAVVINAFEAHTGVHVLVTVPESIPLVGGPITLEAITWGGATAIGISAAVLAVAPLALALDPQQLITALPRRMDRTATAVATSLMLIPALGRTTNAVREAQRLRGWQPRGLRSWGEIITPVVVGAMESAMTLAESMEARGFGCRARRTQWAPAPFGRRDRAVVGAAVMALMVFAVSRLSGWSSDWLPFPSLIAPTISAVPFVVAALLLAPVFAWPRQHSHV